MSNRASAIPRRRPRTGAKRRTASVLIGLALVAAVGYLAASFFEKSYRELALPLRHDDIIRQQARDKDLDPALIAGIELEAAHAVVRNSFRADLIRLKSELVDHGTNLS